MKKTVEIGVASLFIAMGVLTFFLFLSESYFSISALQSVVFGPSGVYIEGTYSSYSELTMSCDSESILVPYCDYLSSLEEGGEVFRLFLLIDLVVLGLSVLEAISLRVSLKTLLASLSSDKGVSPHWLCLAKTALKSRYLLILHPLLLLIGLVAWTLLGKLDELPGQVQLRLGFLTTIFQIFLSVVLVSAYIQYISSSKRKNLALLKKSKTVKRQESTLELMEISQV